MKQIILAFLFVAIAPLHAEELSKILNNSKTVGEFINNSASTLGPKNTDFLRERIKGLEKTPADVRQTGANEFTFNPLTAPMKMVIGNQLGYFKLTVNGHTIAVPKTASIEDLYEQIFDSLPNAQQASWFSIFPQAHAGQIKTAIGAAAGAAAMITAIVGVKGNSDVCPKVTSKLQACMNPKFGYKKEMQEAADVSIDSKGLLMMCWDSSKLYECLQQKAAEKQPKFDEKYYAFFKVGAPPAASTSDAAVKPADGKKD